MQHSSSYKLPNITAIVHMDNMLLLGLTGFAVSIIGFLHLHLIQASKQFQPVTCDTCEK